MLTEEKIKILKKGDPIVINGTVNKINEDGHILATCGGSAVWIDNPYYVSLPSDSQSTATAQLLRSRGGSTVNRQSKYDPTRLFRKGDIIRLKEWNGRCPALPDDWKFDNGLFKVHEDEKFNSSVEITRKNSEAVYIAPICFIELVTPVEELVPYSVHEESMHNRWNVIKDKYVHGIHAMFPYKNIGNLDLMSREEAKARADEYSARLNDEWRKEQNNG